MKKEDILGHFVVLKEDFITRAHDEIDENVPTKSPRPYLVIELNGKSKSQLFAIPVQTNVSDSINPAFFEKLPRRLDTRPNCDCGLLFGQMVPITAEQVQEKKGSDRYIPRDEMKRDIVLQNFWFGNGDNIPKEVRTSFNYLKKQARGYGMSTFQDKQFQQSYKVVANAIFEETKKVKNEKFELITKKAHDYLQNHYMKFLRETVYKKLKSTGQMPTRFTRIDRLVKFLHNYNASAKTSLHEPLAEKYKLTEQQIADAKSVAARENKPLESMIRKNILYAPADVFNSDVKAKIVAEHESKIRAAGKSEAIKTQEKNNSKTKTETKSLEKKTQRKTR